MGLAAVAPEADAAAARERFPAGYWLWTLTARAASAGKEVLLAAVLGTSPWKDALVAAWTAPTLIASYANETLPALLTPLWTRSGGRARPASARRLVMGVVAAQIGLSAAALLWPRALIALVAPGLASTTAAAAVVLERWLAVNIVLLGGQTLLAARWNAHCRFNWMPAGSSGAAAAVMAVLALTPGWALEWRVVWIAAAITIGNALGLLLMLIPVGMQARLRPAAAPAAARTTVSHGGSLERPRAERAYPAASRSPATERVSARGASSTGAPQAKGGRATLWRSLGVLLTATLVLNLVPLAERVAASGLRPGSLAAFDYGERLVQMVFSLTVAPFTVVGFTRLAEAAGGPASLAPRFEAGWQGLLTLTAPAAAALAVFAPLLTRCLYGWGRFGVASVALTAPVVAIKGAGLELDGAFYFLLFALYAQGRERSKLPIALVLAAVNVPLLLWWGRGWGVAGLAAAHVAGCAGALGWITLRRRAYLPGLALRAGARAGAQAGALALLAALAVRALLPAAAVAGRLDGGVSCMWALLALTATALLTAAAAYACLPGLWAGLHQALAPRPLPSGARP